MFHLFAIPPSQSVCSPMLSRVIHQHTFSRLTGAKFTECMTCLTLQTFLFWFPHTIVFSPVFHCLSLHMFELLYVFTCLFLWFHSFTIFLSQCAPTWLNRAIDLHSFSRLAGAHFPDCITCLTSKIFLFLFPTDSCLFTCSFIHQFYYTSICFILMPTFLPSVLP